MKTTQLKTQVGIIGSGPAGLVLAHLLARQGITSIIVERQSRCHVEQRIRAGVLEQGSVDALREAGVASRMDKEGLIHQGFDLAFDGQRHRINLTGLTGKSVMVYGQTELTRDLIKARLDHGGSIVFEANDVKPLNIETGKSRIEWTKQKTLFSLECDFIAGCDGFHGVSRRAIPESHLRVFEREYPFGWLGILSDTPPVAEELVYANHKDGFALCSMRSATRSRYYVQCAAKENIDSWSDSRFWKVLSERIGGDLASNLITGPTLEKSIAPLRSFVAEPMQYGNLFLAGDAAHIVPPTGAKGLNLAIADVRLLAKGLVEHYQGNGRALLGQYSNTCLQRVWKVERFSWFMSALLHQFPDHSAFDKKIQRAEFDYIAGSESASRNIAENYVGLPMPWEVSSA